MIQQRTLTGRDVRYTEDEAAETLAAMRDTMLRTSVTMRHSEEMHYDDLNDGYQGVIHDPLNGEKMTIVVTGAKWREVLQVYIDSHDGTYRAKMYDPLSWMGDLADPDGQVWIADEQ